MPNHHPHLTTPSRDEPLFSIGDISEITGISEATLRVWERRYAFPQTARTSSGWRLYAQREALRLLWVKMWMDAGMRAGQAIRARQLVTRDAAVATALREPLPPRAEPEPAIVAARSPLLEALLAYEGPRAAAILDEVAGQYPLEQVVLDIIGPTLSAIGESWHMGTTAVATEHFATYFLRHRLLQWMHASPAPYRVDPIVLACAPEELHEGSLLMLAVLLRQLRWPVFYLGQSLPLADLANLANRVRPAIIVFVAMTEAAALALADWPRLLEQQSETQPPIVGFGGRAFTENPSLADAVPGTLLGSTLGEGSQRLHRLMLNLTALTN